MYIIRFTAPLINTAKVKAHWITTKNNKLKVIINHKT